MPVGVPGSPGFLYSINAFTGDGAQTAWEFNFAGGYISQDHVKVRGYNPDGTVYPISFTWVGPNTIQISPAIASGVLFEIYRQTPKDLPLIDFTDGAVVSEKNLDTNALQCVFIAAEALDAAITGIQRVQIEAGSGGAPNVVALANIEFTPKKALVLGATAQLEQAPLSDFVRTMLGDADAAAVRTRLGVAAAGEVTDCLKRDGTNSPTANIAWGGFNLTGVGSLGAATLTLSGNASVGGTLTVTSGGSFGGGLTVASLGTFGTLVVNGTTSLGRTTISGSAHTTMATVAATASLTLNCQTSNAIRVTMGVNVTALTLTNPGDGQTINVWFKQDATGGRTIAWPSNFRWGGTAPTLSTAANALDFLAASYSTTDNVWVASLVKGVQ